MATPSKKILLIEDNKAVRENTSEILELANFQVFSAENGKIGVDIAIKENPDLIICDIMMPELDGYGVLHMLNKNPQTSTIPFIFLTAKADRTDFRKGMEMGADDYITKPFDDIELLNAIETRLKKSEMLRTDFSPGTDGITKFFSQAREAAKLDFTGTEYETLDYKKRQEIYTRNHRATHLYYICSGKVKMYLISDDGKEIITHIAKQGDFIGYTSLFEDAPYRDTAEALEDATLMLIPKSDFISLVSSDSHVARQFIKLLAANLVEKENQLLNLAYNSLRKRVATGLIHVFDKYKSDNNNAPELEISRKDLAQVVGTATESLIRTLSDFKEEKLISIKEGKIQILNEEKLRNLLN